MNTFNLHSKVPDDADGKGVMAVDDEAEVSADEVHEGAEDGHWVLPCHVGIAGEARNAWLALIKSETLCQL